MGKTYNKYTEQEKDELVAQLKDFEKEMDFYLMYGTLLGAVREGDLIGHDDDIDIAYLGKATNPKEAIKEIQEVNLSLEKKGLLNLVKPKWKKKGFALGQCFVKNGEHHFDVYHTWLWNGYLIAPHQDKLGKGYFPLETAKLRGVEFKVPRNAEKLLTSLYGDWKKPKEQKVPQRHPFKWVLAKYIS